MLTHFEHLKHLLALSQHLSTWALVKQLMEGLQLSGLAIPLDEHYFDIERQSRQVVNSKGIRFIWFGTWNRLGKSNEYPRSMHVLERKWRGSWSLLNNEKWIVLMWIHNTAVARGILRTMEENNILCEKFEDRLVFMSMYIDIDLGKKQNTKKFVSRILEMLLHSPEDFLKDIGHLSEPGTEEPELEPERTSQNQTVCGTMLLICHTSTPTAHTFFSCALCQRAWTRTCCHQLFFRLPVISSRIDSRGSTRTWSFAELCLA